MRANGGVIIWRENCERDGARSIVERHFVSKLCQMALKPVKHASLHSVRSPRVVDDKAPRAVGLTTQDVRIVSRQLHRFPVWPGSRE